MNELRTTEDRLRAEIEELKRQVEEHKRSASNGHPPAESKAPSGWTLLVVVLLVVGLALAGYLFGYAPRERREAVLAAEAHDQGENLPTVNVTPVVRAENTTSLVLPGNIEAVTEAPVLARASGYIVKRYADIGDRVKANQPLAEIEEPELTQQILQGGAAVEQARSAVEQANANLAQGRTNETLARVTATRFDNLYKKGVISRQDNDTYQAQWEAQKAGVDSLEKAVNAAQHNQAASEANLARLKDLAGYLTVRAPFDGVITERNIDVGALATEGSTLLFRVAQTARLRTYISVPQADAGSVRVGQTATMAIADLPGHKFTGTVARTASALDPSTRTLLVEVQAANPSGLLLPGMYTQVDLAVPRKYPPLLIPGDALVVRADGPQVAVVADDGAVHFARVQLGRDFGDQLEALSGVELGQWLVVNPSDAVREGAKVKAIRSPAKPAPGRRS